MVIDFRRKRTSPPLPLCILGEDVAVVEVYKYLGVHLDNGLNWRINTDAVYKKGMSRLYFLRKLRSFNVCSKMLEIFYQSVVASALFFAAVCWGGSIRAGDTSRIKKLIILGPRSAFREIRCPSTWRAEIHFRVTTGGFEESRRGNWRNEKPS
ncbi:hypothetical protein OYC64_006918 [Pagothenia borchgrevinki]|uniref:Alkylated DNA repair protein AlkB homologue 8 N-terminal domain-containing protein n=1 Tax=Pagothenia borchgrevinki TaxID=8213 RepID=A0ABD2G270_PAGBO